MVEIIFYSDPSIENLFPLRKKQFPLPLQSLLGKPLAIRIAEELYNVGFDRIIISFPGAEKIQSLIDEKAEIHASSFPENPAKTLQNIISGLDDETFLIQFGSFIANNEMYKSLLARWNEIGGSSIVSLIPHNPGEVIKGINTIRAEIDLSRNQITGIDRYTDHGLYFTGLMLADKKITGYINERKDVVSGIIEYVRKTNASYHIWTGEYYSLNDPVNLLGGTKTLLSKEKGRNISLKAKVSPTAILEGPVIVDDGAVIDHYSVIKGPAYIGKNALVGAHSFVRNHVTIEPFATVGAFSEVKRSYIGSGAIVGSSSHITDSVIGDKAILRPMCVTLNIDPTSIRKGKVVKKGSIIGELSLINGGSILPPNTIIEPESIYQSKQ